MDVNDGAKYEEIVENRDIESPDEEVEEVQNITASVMDLAEVGKCEAYIQFILTHNQ